MNSCYALLHVVFRMLNFHDSVISICSQMVTSRKIREYPAFHARFVGFRLINRKIKFVQIWSTVAGYGEFCVCL